MSALAATALAFGGLTLAATPSHAESNSCSSPTPMAGAATSSIGPSDRYDYWSYETLAGRYTVTMSATTAGPGFNVLTEGCGAELCDGSGSTTETCSFVVATPQTVAIRVFSAGAADETYTLTVTWDDDPGVPPLGTQCSDGVDNDSDGQTDTADSGCSSAIDTTEGGADPCPVVAGLVTCLSLTAGDKILGPLNVYGPDLAGEITVVGSIDLYQFETALGNVNLPCVVLQGVNPCAALGGEYFATMFVLGPHTVPLPDPVIDEYVTSISLCEAQLTATVAGIGVEDFFAVTVC